MIRLAPRFAEFAATTNYSFLAGASHPEEMVGQAMALGLAGLGIADRNSVAGVVRAHVFARQHKAADKGLRVVAGARLVFADGTPDILAYPQDRAAWGRLCRLLTEGNRRTEKGDCLLSFDDFLAWREGLQIALLDRCSYGGDGQDATTTAWRETASARRRACGLDDEATLAAALKEACGDRLRLAATALYDVDMRGALARRAALARRSGVALMAVNDPLMHVAERRPLADVIACIRAGATLDAAGRLLLANAERHLKDAAEMTRLFAETPGAVEESLRFLDDVGFSLDELGHDYPEELREGYPTPQAALDVFAREGAKRRYPDGVPETVAQALDHELALIARLRYAAYFLTVHDIVRFARSKGILCQGRGSAANSTVCFCLEITEVDPTTNRLLFERFISADRDEPPDIDVDFEHERREDVIQYIYERYGRDRAGLAASVTTYRARSAIREVGKAFGLSEDMVGALSGLIWGWWSGKIDLAEARRLGVDPEAPQLKRTMALAEEISGFPRHLSQHVGGFVITRGRLDETVPILNAAMADRTNVEWDKDDLEALGLLKIDVLGLGMLSCLNRGFALLHRHYGVARTLASLRSACEERVYAMIQRADTIGVFQIESRAQMSMLPRLKPACFYDLVIEVAIVRPGPIQGDMVHPYLRRRQGLEKPDCPSPELEEVLGKTYGVPLFQEQAMRIAIVAAGFTPSEADQLRRAMATFRRVGTIGLLRAKMVDGMVARGYAREFAERCFKQIEGFGEYGFPESHAASFALLVYASAWMKCRYPDVFAAALLNAQPMGFYAPAQIVRDAREHGVETREPDVNFSDWDCTLEPREPGAVRKLHPRHASMQDDIAGDHALRLGLRQVAGLREEEMNRLVERRGAGYDSLRDVWLRADLPQAALERLAEADAFRSLGLDRRAALWAARGLNRVGDQDDLPLFAVAGARAKEPDADLPPMPLGEHVVEDYRHLSLSLKAHPVAFMRRRLDAKGIVRNADLAAIPAGAKDPRRRVAVAGLAIVRQRPGSARGVIFMTIEDETGIANVIVWPKVFERQRPVVIAARFVAVSGYVQNEAGVVHVVAQRLEDLTPMLGALSAKGEGLSSLARADEIARGERHDSRDGDEPGRARMLAPVAAAARAAMPKGRNFH